MALDDGKPKLIAQATAPNDSSREGNWSVSYPAASNDQAQMGSFHGQKQDGLVLVALQLPQDSDWHVTDQIEITQQVGQREESAPIRRKFVYYTGGHFPKNPHETYAVAERIDACLASTIGQVVVKPTIYSNADYAVTPCAPIQLYKDGFAVGKRITANEAGQFAIEFPEDPCGGV